MNSSAPTMPRTNSFFAKRKPPKNDNSLCDHDDIVEKMGMRMFMNTDLTIPTDFNILVSGLMTALKTFEEHPSTKKLVFVEYEEKDMSKKKRLCQTIVNVLKDIKCPHELEAHQFVYLDYEALAPMCYWVLKQSLLADCRNIPIKTQYTNFFLQTFKTGEESNKAFRKAYGEILKDYPGRFRTFKDHVFGKKLSGKKILVEYIVDHYSQPGDSNGSEFVGLPADASREAKAKYILEKDGKSAALKQYRCMAARWIEKLDYDDLIQPLERRIENEGRAYFMTKIELQFIEGHLCCAEGRAVYDTTIIPKLLRHMDDLMVRLRVFQNTAHQDSNATDEMLQKLGPKAEQKGSEKAGITKPFLNQYTEFSTELRKIAASAHKLVMQLAAATAETLGTEEREARIDALDEIQPLTGEEYFLPIDETIIRDILNIGHKFNRFANILELPEPAENTRAELYQKFLHEYISDVRFKLSDMYWKAEMIHHHRVEAKIRVDTFKKQINAIQKQEIKTSMKIDIIDKVNEVIVDVEAELEELIKASQEVRRNMLRVCADAVTPAAAQ